MFTGQLFTFQETHELNLLRKCADHQELILFAPTGSGKTVIVSKFIDDYLDENPNTVFLWLCPGAGSLEKQSQERFRAFTSGIPDGDVYDFIGEGDPKGKVFFINWDKINRASNLVLREGEYRDFMSKILFCHTNGIKVFMLIDEEHKYQDTANEYVANIQPVHVLRISATPVSKGDHVEMIKDEEVIYEGLIASGISINEGVSDALEEKGATDQSIDLLLIELADQKRKELQREYDRLGVGVNPLVLIQFPSGSDYWIERVLDKLESIGYSRNSDLVTAWFSGDHPDHPEEIKELNGQYAFLLFKQAIATGWDCPRAKILVKLREGGSERFNVQTIGRIRRMPEQKHYDNSLLDYCYLYTLDSEYTEGLTNSINEQFYTSLYKRKLNAPNIVLTKESLKGSDRYTVNPEAVVEAVRARMLSDCDFNHDGKLDKKEMEIGKGYIFGTKLKFEAVEGVARTTHDMLSLNTVFSAEHEISNKFDGFIIRDAKRKIANAIGIDEDISNRALHILFGPLEEKYSLLYSAEEIAYEENKKLLHGLSLREYNAFLVNNRDRLVNLFKDIDAEKIAEIEESPIIQSEWFIPREQYYKHSKLLHSTKTMNKNVFMDYGNDILLHQSRTVTERAFEEWCENNPAVKWCYKNGDKGDEYFSIVYRRAFRRNNFYPDYIIQLCDGQVWIIEAKGGMTSDGLSNNVDPYAGRKFDALKDYTSRNPATMWGFVRAVGTEIYLSNTIWAEDVTNDAVWKPINTIIQ